MTYNEFKTEIMQQLQEKAILSEQIGAYKLFEDGAVSDDKEDYNFITETNIRYSHMESDVLKGDFLRIYHKDQKASVARYEMRYLFESYEESGWDFVWKIIEDNLAFAKTVDIANVVEFIDDYDVMKERTIMRALNFADNRYELKNYVYKRIGDMALVLYLFISETEKYGLATTKVSKEVFENWGKDWDEVMNTALVNSNIRSVPRMYNTPQEADKPAYNVGAYMALGSNCKLMTGMRTSIFTTRPVVNGAVSFWYPGVQEKIAEMAGGDYYIAFTGIHDFRVHPVGTVSAREVLLKLKNMNQFNEPDETLSRKVYRYHADTKELEQLEL